MKQNMGLRNKDIVEGIIFLLVLIDSVAMINDIGKRISRF